MNAAELQISFLKQIKNQLPSHLSLVDVIAEQLNLSNDSAYRRIRGESPLSLNELKVLCEYFHLSLDQLLQINNDTVVFQAFGINAAHADFTDYLKGLLKQLKFFNSFEKREMLYQCKDAPFFYFYLFPEIGAFKTFCWLKSILNKSDYQNKTFSLHEFPFEECNKLGQIIIKEYTTLPSTELWNLESFNSSMNQLEYYKQAGLFKSEKDFIAVLHSFEKMLDHIQAQAQSGIKFMPGEDAVTHTAPIKFYVNEIIIGNNSFILDLNGERLSIITYNVLDYMLTKDIRFCKKVFEGFNTLVSRSTLISGTGEKERNKFFRAQREKINQLKR